MTDYTSTLNQIAQDFGVEPAVLERYLFEELDAIKSAALFESRLAKLEQILTYGSTGVFYCLIERTDRPSPRPRTISDYASKLLEGVYRASVERGYVVIHKVNNVTLATPDYFRSMLNKHPNAGVLLLIPQGAEVLAPVCVEMGRQCLILDYDRPASLPVHTLNIDNRGAVRTLTHDLISLGHRRIAYVTGLLHYYSAAERLAGYRAALEEAGLPVDPALVVSGNWEMAMGRQCGADLLSRKNPPTAIICSNDLTALGVYEAIQEAGLSIPFDVSVVGFDDIPIVANIQPPLTTVRQSMVDMGASAAALLIEAMEGGLAGEYVHTHRLELIYRASTGPAHPRS